MVCLWQKKVYLRLLEAPSVVIVIVVFDVVVHIVISIDLVVVLVVIANHIIHSWGQYVAVELGYDNILRRSHN